MVKYYCKSFKESYKEGFIEVFEAATHSEYVVQVYDFKNDDNRSEFILSYCPFCGKKLEAR